MPKGFFPQQDTGAVTGGLQGPQDASFEVMDKSVQQIAKVIKDDPGRGEHDLLYRRPGCDQHRALFTWRSSPWRERGVGAPEIIARLRPKLNHLQAASVFLQAAQDLRIGGRGSNAMYQYTLQSDNPAELSHWGPVILGEMKHLPGFTDVNSDQQNGGRDELLTYDRLTAARLGLTVQNLDSALYSAFGQSEVSIIYTQLNQYYIVLEVAPKYWATPAGLKDTYLAAPEQRAHPAGRRRQGPHRHHPAGDQPHGPVSLGHAFLQPRARRCP